MGGLENGQLLFANTLHCTALHCTALHCTALHCTALHCTALHCTALHCPALHCTALHCTALHCTALHCTALHCTALHCTALQCTALHCTALHFMNISPAGYTVCRLVCHDYGRPRWVSVSARDPGGADLTDGSSTEQAEMTQDSTSQLPRVLGQDILFYTGL